MINNSAIIRFLGQEDYLTVWRAMQRFTDLRDENTLDEIWVVQHPPIFTLGQNGKTEHILSPGNIEVINVDRGGQVTYHGPGQLLAYTMVDLKRKKLNVRQMVSILENSIINLLENHSIQAKSMCKAPGVYISDKKISSIGLRVRRGATFHGLALNVAMDLEPFTRINPCGFEKLQMTQLIEHDNSANVEAVSKELVGCLMSNLGYTNQLIKTGMWHESK
jgi:lipoyl(octanoyl) transferase